MNKFQAAMKVAGRFIDDNLPTILSGLALVGLGASVVTAVKETPNAMHELETEQHKKLFTASEEELAKIGAKRVDEKPNNYTELGYDAMVSTEKDGETTDVVLFHRKKVLTPWEKFKALAPVYWPCALSTLATAGCIIGSNVVSKKRYLGLAALMATQSKHFEEYQDKVKELFGDKKEEEVKKEMAKDAALNCPQTVAEKYVPGVRYPISFLGAWWDGTKQEVEDAFTRWNQDGMDEAMLDIGYDGMALICLSDLCDKLGQATRNRFFLPDTNLLKHIAWNIRDGIVKPDFKPGETLDGVPCYMVDFNRKPDFYTD